MGWLLAEGLKVYWRIRAWDYRIFKLEGDPVMNAHAHLARDRWGPAGVVGASLLLVAALLTVAGLVMAIEERLVEPPAFALHLGPVYLSAPCPAPTLVCDTGLNYYSVWRGYDLPDG